MHCVLLHIQAFILISSSAYPLSDELVSSNKKEYFMNTNTAKPYLVYIFDKDFGTI